MRFIPDDLWNGAYEYYDQKLAYCKFNNEMSDKKVDYQGNEITLGCTVVFKKPNNAGLQIGKVAKFTPKGVTMSCEDSYYDKTNRPFEEVLVLDDFYLNNLYAVSRTDQVGYDEFDSFICSANTPEEARAMHPCYPWTVKDNMWVSTTGGEQDCMSWVLPHEINTLTVVEIGQTKMESGVVLASFNAG